MNEATIRATGERTPERGDAATAGRAVRRGSVVAGLALLVMTPLAAYANFVALDGLVVPGNAARTASAVLGAEGTFRVAVASLLVVAVLDLTVAWALYAVFEPVNRGVAALMALFRAAFAAVFVVAISRLASVPGTLHATGFDAAQRDALALLAIEGFYDVWDAALILVGLHLALLGYLVYRSGAVPSYRAGLVPKVLGVLLVVAGAGYVVDSFGGVLVAGYSLEVAAFTFLGEVLLIGWLLVYGRRVDRPGAAAASAK